MRLARKDRKAQIMESAVIVATRDGFDKLTRELIAEQAEISPSLINQYFNTMTGLRRAVMRHAVRNEILSIIAQGIATRNPYAFKASAELIQRAVATLSQG